MNRIKALKTIKSALETLVDQIDDLLLTDEFIEDRDLEEINLKLEMMEDNLREKIENESREED